MASIDSARVAQLTDGVKSWSRATSAYATLDIAEDGFSFDDLTVGLVLSNQPDHWTRYSDNKACKLSLLADTVAKVFLAYRREILIQELEQLCTIISCSGPFGFLCCAHGEC